MRKAVELAKELELYAHETTPGGLDQVQKTIFYQAAKNLKRLDLMVVLLKARAESESKNKVKTIQDKFVTRNVG